MVGKKIRATTDFVLKEDDTNPELYVNKNDIGIIDARVELSYKEIWEIKINGQRTLVDKNDFFEVL